MNVLGTTSSSAISAHDVAFSYGTHTVLSGVSVEVRRGAVVGLLGPNGTGKSTLLGILSGDLEPRAGSVSLLGKEIGAYARKELARTRAVMPQSSDFPFAYLARDIVAMGRQCWDSSPEEDHAIIEGAMRRADVLELADREVTQLSGGERARVTLARVLAQESDIVFLDEPTAAFDIAHQELTMQLCRNLATHGITVVAVMHDIQLAAAYCDDIALMHGGGIVAYGEPESVLTSERLSEVYRWPITTMRLAGGDFAILPRRDAAGASAAGASREPGGAQAPAASASNE